MIVASIVLTKEDFEKCRAQLAEVASIVGEKSELYLAIRDSFDTAEDVGDDAEDVYEKSNPFSLFRPHP